MIETIKTFGINIWQWFVENKDGITAFFMSGQFVTLIGAGVALYKTTKHVKVNTDSNKLLNTALNRNTELSDSMSTELSESMKTLSNNFNLLKLENDSLRDKLVETENALQSSNALIVNSLNAILEVQSIVYSTIRDDEIRITVNKLLNNARYADKNFKLEMQNEIEAMKKEFEDKVKDMNDALNASVDRVTSTIQAGSQAEEKARNTVESIRY